MKAIATITAIACALLFSTVTYACDEACLKEAAEKKHNIEFPGYLSWDYCNDLRMDFMTRGIRSLENYQANHLNLRYKGGMRNIAKFIEQRQSWIKECDQYLTYTGKNPIFEDKETTKKMFAAMDRVQKELNALAKGVTYSTSLNEEPDAVINARFNKLFTLVENHKALMHLQGKYVFR